jgi:fumarate reductase flavoprotein subunit
MIPAGGSRWQVEHGIDDSPEQFLNDMVRATDGTVDPRVSSALTSVAPQLVEWLADECGVPLELATDFIYPGHSARRCHTLSDRSGKSLIKYLLAAIDARDNITLVTPLELSAIREAEGSLEAQLSTPDGDSAWEQFSSVVLATNGYAGDAELLRENIPDIVDAYYHGGDGSLGHAVRIGRSLGAETSYLDAYQGHGSLAMPHAILLTWAVMVHGGIMVNRDGRRFADESGSYSSFGAKVIAQPERIGWAIFDERISELCEPFADYQDIMASKAVHEATSVDELAAIIGCDVGSLREQLAAVESHRAGRDVDPLGRLDFGKGLNSPYRAVRVTGALFHTQGGLVVDERARVQRDGAPIPGLYAAGGSAVGASGHGSSGYLAGNGLLGALGLGYLAGRDAAATNV